MSFGTFGCTSCCGRRGDPFTESLQIGLRSASASFDVKPSADSRPTNKFSLRLLDDVQLNCLSPYSTNYNFVHIGRESHTRLLLSEAKSPPPRPGSASTLKGKHVFLIGRRCGWDSTMNAAQQ
eukprot:6144653-Amphidinium_carterae.3